MTSLFDIRDRRLREENKARLAALPPIKPPPVMLALTPGQQRGLDFIRNYIAENRVAPPIAKIATGLGVSLSNAHRTVTQLERRGHIRRQRSFSNVSSRAIALVERAHTCTSCGHVDRVTQ